MEKLDFTATISQEEVCDLIISRLTKQGIIKGNEDAKVWLNCDQNNGRYSAQVRITRTALIE